MRGSGSPCRSSGPWGPAGTTTRSPGSGGDGHGGPASTRRRQRSNVGERRAISQRRSPGRPSTRGGAVVDAVGQVGICISAAILATAGERTPGWRRALRWVRADLHPLTLLRRTQTPAELVAGRSCGPGRHRPDRPRHDARVADAVGPRSGRVGLVRGMESPAAGTGSRPHPLLPARPGGGGDHPHRRAGALTDSPAAHHGRAAGGGLPITWRTSSGSRDRRDDRAPAHRGRSWPPGS